MQNSSPRFAIASLPRSGSCWVSQLFNLSPEVLCYHELIAREDIDDIDKHVEGQLQEFEYVGDCCGTYLDPQRYTPKKVAWIERDPDDCFVSSEIWMESQIPMERWALFLDMKKRWIAVHKPFIIHFRDLFTMEGAHALWTEMVDSPFPAEKVGSLIRSNVQRQGGPSYDFDLINKRLSN